MVKAFITSHNNQIYNINTDDGLNENNVYTMALADNGEVLAGTDQGISICKISRSKKNITISILKTDYLIIL